MVQRFSDHSGNNDRGGLNLKGFRCLQKFPVELKTLNVPSDFQLGKPLKRNFLFDSSSAPRLVFLFIDYFYLLIICTETFTRTFTI